MPARRAVDRREVLGHLPRLTAGDLEAALFELTDAVTMLSLDGRVLLANPAALRLHGLASLEDCRGQVLAYPEGLDLTRPDGTLIPIGERPLARALRGEFVREEPVHHVERNTGERSIGLHTTIPIRAREGGWFIKLTVRDVTEETRRQDQIRESERRLSLVLEGSDDGFWDLDHASGRYVYSARCFEMIGERPETVRSPARFWRRRLHPDDMEALRLAQRALLSGHAAGMDVDYRLRHRDGSWKWVRARGKGMEFNASGQPTRFAGTLRDVSARHAAQDQLRSALVQNERLVAELSEALQNVKTLKALLPICAWCGKIRDDTGKYEKIEAYISKHTDTKFTHGMCAECFARL